MIMGLSEMGMGAPEQKTPERNKNEIANQIVKNIEEQLADIHIGSYTADKKFEGGYCEDLFVDPVNLDKVLDEVKNKIDISINEKWSREKLEEELSKIKINFDFSRYENNDHFPDFHASRHTEEPLSEFIYIDDIVDMLYDRVTG